jgi:hypothetical protein
MILIAAIGVAVGIFRDVPGLAIALLVSVIPAVAITGLKARKRQRRGEPMSGCEGVAWVVGFMFLIPIVVAVAVALALFTFCSFMPR